MEQVTFGRTGLSVSRLGFGGAPIGFLDTEQAGVAAVLGALLDAGVNVIDTAAAYPGSEEAIGKAIAGRRDGVVLVSKCGQAFPDLEGEAWSERVILQTVDRSLKRLGTDRLDVMLLHSCGLDVLRKGEALGALVKAREAGKVRFPGYSGDNEAAAWAAARPEVFAIETSVNVADQRNIDAVLPVCVREGVGVLAKRPIANAAWKDPERQPGMYKGYSSEYTKRLRAMGITPGDLGREGPADVEWPGLALRFTLSQPGVHTAIVGTTSVDSARANVSAAGKGPLAEEAVRKLREAFARAERASGGAWEGQT